jgi:hypothetical protein
MGTPELVLLLVALGGMTAAATWAVVELKKAAKMNVERAPYFRNRQRFTMLLLRAPRAATPPRRSAAD